MPLYYRIFLGMFIGFVIGLLGHFISPIMPSIDQLFQLGLAPVGQLFLQLIFMMVLPLVVCALTLASYRLCLRDDMPKLATKAIGGALVMAFCASIIAFVVAQFIPSDTLSEGDRLKLLQLAGPSFAQSSAATSGPWYTVISRNPLHAMSQAFVGGSIAPVMIFAGVLGFSLARSASSKTHTLLEILEAIQEACFAWIGWLMKHAAPWAVACLIASSVQTLGLSFIRLLGGYILAVMIALLLQMVVVYGSILKLGAGVNPLLFFQKIRTVLLTAFSTSSSSATLPLSLACARQDLKLEPDASRLILSFGASANQNGSALYEGVTLLFLCQLFGVSLSFSDQLLVLGMCMTASFGTAGVPGGTIPLMASMLQSLGVPPSSLLLVLGVDRLLDMARTTVNVAGDLVLAQWLDRDARGASGAKPD